MLGSSVARDRGIQHRLDDRVSIEPSISATVFGVKAFATSLRNRPWAGSSAQIIESPTSLMSFGAKRPPKPNNGGAAAWRGSFEKRGSRIT